MKSTAILFLISFLPVSLLAQCSIFYGMTEVGGTNDRGTIFSFNPVTNTEKVLWNFGSGTDGALPVNTLVYFPGNGLFYGTTDLGGIYGGVNTSGTIFSFNPTTNVEKVVWNFGNGTDAISPDGGLVYYAGNGLFYGMTDVGGVYGNFANGGTIYSFNPLTNSENVVWSFGNGTDGSAPFGNLVYNASNGLFYGLTYSGGSNNIGTIFTFNPTTNTEKVVWNFGNGKDGWEPNAELVYYSGNGLFYGVTVGGGNNGGGIIFSFNPITNTENIVWNFGSGTDGEKPWGDLVYNAVNGLFYGMTEDGGAYFNSSKGIGGTIFSFDPLTNTENVVWSFGNGTDGSAPSGDNNLVYDPNNGLFYGMTTYGGAYGPPSGNGVIFSFDPSTNTENVVWNFGLNPPDGSSPYGSLVLFTQPITATINASKDTICPLTNLTLASADTGVDIIYNWSTGATTSTIVVDPTVSTTYSLQVTVAGCIADSSITIFVKPQVIGTACCNTTITAGQTVQLNVSPLVPGNTYNWVPNTGLSCDTCPNPVASPSVTTSYYITITDSEGCSKIDTATIDVGCNTLFVPDAFSPNNDGQNDVLYVRGDCIKTMDFVVYDRWGNKVFESNSTSQGWDGKYKDQPMSTGTYAYYLSVLTYDGNSITKKGNVALVR